MSVLIVVNNQKDCEWLKSLLTKEGHTVKTASHGKEALTLLEREHVDIVISEVILPVMDGFHLLRMINQNKAFRKIPFVFLSDAVDEEDIPFIRMMGGELFKKSQITELLTYILNPSTPALTSTVIKDEIFFKNYSVVLKKILDSTLRETEEIQKKLSQSEMKYLNLFEGAHDATFIMDRKGGHIEANKKASELLGYKLEEFKSLSFREVVVPDYIPDSEDKLKKILKSEDLPVYEKKFRAKDGREIPVEVSVSGIRDESGEVTYILSIVRDITERRKAEEALLKSEKQYRDLFINTPIGIYRTNPDGQVLMANPALVRMLGYESFEELARLNLEDEGSKTGYSRSTFKELIERDGRVVGLESGWIKKDENLLFFRENARVVRDDEGNILYFEGTLEDISERKKAEEQLRESEEQYRNMIESAPDGIITINLKGLVTSCNTATMKLTGYPKDKIIGKYFSELGFLRISELPRYIGIFKSILEGKIPESVEVSWTHEDGSNRWGEAHASLMKKGNKVSGIQAIIRDITGRKMMEEALKESEEKYRTLVENSKDSIVIIDLRGNVIFANKSTEELTGYTMEEGLGMNVRKITPLRYWPKSLAMLKKAITGEPVPYFESVIRRKDKTRVPVESGGQAIYKDGKIVGIQIITRDITERKKAEEQIKASLREKEVLLREIHHRVKNNMQIISSLLNLQSRYSDDERLLEAFRDCQNRIKSMALVHEKLYQSKNLASIDFKEYVRSLLGSLIQLSRIDSERITLHVDVEDVSLQSDQAIPCGLIINELVSNCMKHAFPGTREGEIIISVRKKGSRIELAVRDNGVGIPESLDIREVKSLGLRLVTILAEDQLSGEIKVEKNKGTEVSITFDSLS